MKEIQIEELRELQMQILDYVDAFCRKHGIKYTISGGTLLGAVRHGGFIPWDDDIDIQMLREEYVRFTKLWNSTKEKHPFEFISIESGNSMGYPFGKIHNPKTVTYIGKLERTGVFIDVFPVDNVIDEEDFNIRHSKVMELYRERSVVFERIRYKLERPTLKTWLRMLFSKRSRKTYNEIAEEINKVALEKAKEDAPFRYEMIAGTKCKHPIPKTVFENYTTISFEDRKYMSVADYDTYLTQTFGDYMTPPPASKQIPHHFKAYLR